MKFKAACDGASLSQRERLGVVNFSPQDWAVDGQFIDLDQAEIGHA